MTIGELLDIIREIKFLQETNQTLLMYDSDNDPNDISKWQQKIIRNSKRIKQLEAKQIYKLVL